MAAKACKTLSIKLIYVRIGISKVKQFAKDKFFLIALNKFVSSDATICYEDSPKYQNLMKRDCSDWISNISVRVIPEKE